MPAAILSPVQGDSALLTKGQYVMGEGGSWGNTLQNQKNLFHISYKRLENQIIFMYSCKHKTKYNYSCYVQKGREDIGQNISNLLS